MRYDVGFCISREVEREGYAVGNLSVGILVNANLLSEIHGVTVFDINDTEARVCISLGWCLINFEYVVTLFEKSGNRMVTDLLKQDVFAENFGNLYVLNLLIGGLSSNVIRCFLVACFGLSICLFARKGRGIDHSLLRRYVCDINYGIKRSTFNDISRRIN